MEKSDAAKKVHVHPLAIASVCDHYTRVGECPPSLLALSLPPTPRRGPQH